MPDFPKPRLGDIYSITMTSPDLERSLEYYKKLGFAELWRAHEPFPWIQISDGTMLIMLRQGNDPYISLTYYIKELDKVVAELEKSGITFSQKPKASDMIKRYTTQSPDRLHISLVTYVEGFKQPTGATMLSLPPEDYQKPEKYTNKVCGLFGEFSHPVKDLDASIAFWQILGFMAISKFPNPYPWAILTDGLSIIGLHQTKDFSTPTITFFASDMKDKIGKLKAHGLQNWAYFMGEEHPGHIVLTTPEQQHIFLFSF